jgi:hypothetical protein
VGAEAWLAGRVGLAWRAFAMAEDMAGEEQDRLLAKDWQQKCRNVTRTCADRPLWERLLAREGRSLSELNVTKYREPGEPLP